eukprot:gene2285-3014_t
MGFSSAGRDQGSTFYFELPLYNAASVGLDPEQAARKILLLSQNRLASTPSAERRSNILSGSWFDEDQGVDRDGAGPDAVAKFTQTGAVESESAIVLGWEENLLAVTPPRRRPSPREKNPGPSGLSDLATTSCAKIYPDESIASEEPKPVRLLLVDDSAMNRKVMARIISGEKRGRLAVTELLEADDGISAVETL